MNMKKWLTGMISSDVKRPLPILSFPAVQLLKISVRELIMDSSQQTLGMMRVAQRTDSAAAVGMMDLSVEAEAFGSAIRVSDDEVPTVIGRVVNSYEDAAALRVPEVGEGRTGLYVKAVADFDETAAGRPILAGSIGPFSLAGRLADVTEIMVKCYEEPETVEVLLRKSTEFIIKYINAFKAAGAGGVVIAEPLSGLLSPGLMEEFAAPYIKQIVDAVQTDEFIVVYHNCGDNTPVLLDIILGSGAAAYHFGNSVDIESMIPRVPGNIAVMGNIDPVTQFRNGTPESMTAAVRDLLGRCSKYKNFILSSGCDIPPASKWENIDAFFRAAADFYAAK